ncbi:AEC family transporter [Sutterella sp.]|uniref:AEC family transporter n=1 Tax=Sutterella sp. TaxID=1981025 RepID=UPI0026DFB922|nr:AEC family transporter [Sutterella sp.]MDO5531155.1 AEC family transporter [Sutterella sp.]
MLEAFLNSLNCVIIMGLLAGAGYWTATKGWYDQTASALLARLVTFLSLPCYLFASVSEKLTHDQLIALAGPMVIPFISIWTVFFLSRLVIRLGRIENTHSGVFSSAFTASNNMFIGLPVSIALFGEDAVIPTLLYFFANTTFFWTLGNFLEARDGARVEHKQTPKVFSLATLKRVFSPPLCGFLLAIVLLLLNLRLPQPIMSAAKYMGGITTPLALIFIGLMIHTIGIRRIRFTKDVMLMFLGRFILSPLVCLGITMLLPVPELFAKVYVIQAALPCITQIAVLARYHHADVEFATTAVASTTLLSAAILPVWMMILTAIG